MYGRRRPATARPVTEVSPLGGLAHLRGDQQRDAGLAGHQRGGVHAFVGAHPAEERGVAAVTVAQGERVDIDTMVDHGADLHPEGQLRVPLRDRDDGHPVVRSPGKRAELAVERPVVRGHDGHVEPLAVDRADERVVVDDVGVPFEDRR